ncbi:hypothetical protein ACFUIT_36150 [Streptomyces sp. NPDC057239]|uniref:hypothetical protein n=1 Tax=Streptomyces sp. NPDC057239 TaxID=3346061 RepID=UPI00362ABD01
MPRMLHGRAAPQRVTESTEELVLRPSAESGDLVFIQNADTMTERQYTLVEYRRRRGQDAFLPDSDDLCPPPGNRALGETTDPPLDLPDGRWSGGTVEVEGNPGDETMAIDVRTD